MKYSAIGTSKYGETPVTGKMRLAPNAGLSLIEVLIAMVILLLGIYAVLKIFPAGFAIINADRQRSVANSLAQAELERCKLLADSGNIPEAIIATDYSGAAINDYDPRDLTPAQEDYFSSGAIQPFWQPDSVYLPRTIIGERAIIPATASGQFPFYVLQFAPIADFTTSDVLKVYEANPFTRITGTPLAGQYAVTNATGVFTLDSGYNGKYFAVTYSWIGTDGVVRNVISESRQLASGAFTITVAGDALFQQLVPSSEKVYLQYQLSGSNPPPQGEFYLDTSSFITGIIYFNAADIGKTIGIDYRVSDWSIIREDYEIPADSSIPVRAAVSGGIKGPGYTNPPRQTQPQKLPDGTNYVLAVDLATGDIYEDMVSGSNKLIVDYRAGTIQFPTDTVARTVRIYYRGRRDWIVQVQKAAAGYALVPGSAPDYKSFTWAGGKTLKFALSEAGKTVSISYYRDITAGESHQYVTDELVTIGVGGQASFCPPANAVPSAANNFKVKGLSLTARAVWAGAGRSTVPTSRSISGRREFLNETWLQNRVTTLLTAPMQ